MTLNVNSLLCRKFYACWDQMVEARITRFSLQSSTIPQYKPIEFDDDIQGSPLIWGLKIGWGGFQLREDGPDRA